MCRACRPRRPARARETGSSRRAARCPSPAGPRRGVAGRLARPAKRRRLSVKRSSRWTAIARAAGSARWRSAASPIVRRHEAVVPPSAERSPPASSARRRPDRFPRRARTRPTHRTRAGPRPGAAVRHPQRGAGIERRPHVVGGGASAAWTGRPDTRSAERTRIFAKRRRAPMPGARPMSMGGSYLVGRVYQARRRSAREGALTTWRSCHAIRMTSFDSIPEEP